MESLLANYASSDEEEEQQHRQPPPPPSHVSSLPQPKSSSLFSSLPHPKQTSQAPNIPIDHANQREDVEIPKPSVPHPKTPSNLFSSLPQPKSQAPQQQQPTNVKRIVQFKPPIIPTNHDDDDDEDDDDEKKERRRRRESETLAQGPSVKSFLSSIPAPRNSTTLGVAPTSGSGRRSIIETQVPTSTSAVFEDKNEASINQNVPNYSNYESGIGSNAGNSGNYQSSVSHNAGNYGNYESVVDQNVGHYATYADYGSYQSSSGPNIGSIGGVTSYGTCGDFHGQYENTWVDGSAATTLPEITGMAEIGVKVKGKRGRNELPTEIVEVRQDELMKNRPREDQVKMTGIAFGPSYQPAATKGKPSKLHKRKHQIGSLYFDMKQKEMELQERRSRGLLTKAETQAKYGW
ncbi:PREDICTED: proline-rich protein PRCC [Theobroma cacao]|uniref:Proline-rich protein PRCC n=1 Tax=Theobroma cacao TaxID=3641 RepID=A0AB32X0R2_THECC|nr:PREDICTED: proline-rich protein PRCC [Theobroma cacao]